MNKPRFLAEIVFLNRVRLGLGESDDISVAEKAIEDTIKMMTLYEQSVRTSDFKFRRAYPRPGITEIYIPVETRYKTIANLRCMFQLTDRGAPEDGH